MENHSHGQNIRQHLSSKYVSFVAILALLFVILPIAVVNQGQAVAAAAHKPKPHTNVEPPLPTLQGTLISAGPSRKQCVELPKLPLTNGAFNISAGVAAFEAQTGTSVSCILTYTNGATNWSQWENPWIIAPYSGETAWVAASPQSRQLIIQVDLIPASLENQSDPMGWERSCADGEFNEYAQQLGTNLVSAGLGNSVIRLGAEMNGPWEADFVGTTSTEQSLWSTCFANEVTALRQAAGENFLIDWNPNACYENIPFNNIYPGNSFVDIMGLDFYDGSCLAAKGSTTQVTWNQLVNLPASLVSFESFAQLKGKPMSFPEWGLMPTPNGDDPAYVNGVGSTFTTGNFAFEGYFDSGDGDTLPIGSSTPLSLAAFQKWFQ